MNTSSPSQIRSCIVDSVSCSVRALSYLCMWRTLHIAYMHKDLWVRNSIVWPNKVLTGTVLSVIHQPACGSGWSCVNVPLWNLKWMNMPLNCLNTTPTLQNIQASLSLFLSPFKQIPLQPLKQVSPSSILNGMRSWLTHAVLAAELDGVMFNN